MSDKAYSSEPFSLPADPVDGLDAVTKQYVDDADALKVSKSGDTMTGPLYLPVGGAIVQPNQAASKEYVDDYIANNLPDAGDIAVTPAGDLASTDVQAALEELDDEKVSRSGDTMTGLLQLSGDPVSSLHASTRQHAERQGTFAQAISLSGLPFEVTVTHNMGRRVNVMLEDNAGDTGFAAWVYDSIDPLNKVVISFSYAFNGRAILT